jgi:hypothetical protein
MELDAERDKEREMLATIRLAELGFTHVGYWQYKKEGLTFDLSAADLDQIERIEREKLFVRQEQQEAIREDNRKGIQATG